MNSPMIMLYRTENSIRENLTPQNLPRLLPRWWCINFDSVIRSSEESGHFINSIITFICYINNFLRYPVISAWVGSQMLTPRASSCSIGFIVKCLDLGSLHTLIPPTTSLARSTCCLHFWSIELIKISFKIFLDKFYWFFPLMSS